MKKYLLMCGTILTGLFLCSCQANPEHDYVANKNEGVLESRINESTRPEAEDTEVSGSEEQPGYTDEFMTATGDVKVIVDAKVDAIKGNVPVLRVRPREITMDEVKLWCDVLFEGQTAYEPRNELSKAEIEQEILWRKQKIGDRDALLEEYNGREDEVENLIEYYNMQIKDYEEMYETAPDEVDKKESDWTFHPSDYYSLATGWDENNPLYISYNKTMEFKAVATLSNNHIGQVSAANRDEEDYKLFCLNFFYADEHKMFDIPYKEMRQQEAETLAGQTIEKLGLTDWKLTQVRDMSSESASDFDLYYSRVYEDVASLPGFMMLDMKSEDQYAANLYYEQLNVRIINGIIRAVRLYSPMEVIEVENTNVETISVDEAYRILTEQMKNQYSSMKLMGTEYAEGLEVHVTDMVQGLFRVKIRDNSEDFRMVPAWTLIGTVYSNGEPFRTDNLVVINAVDGTVIDPNLGY